LSGRFKLRVVTPGGEQRGQALAGGDVELEVDVAQVLLDGLPGDEQLLSDCGIREAGRGELAPESLMDSPHS
jgi:hypothetical protein